MPNGSLSYILRRTLCSLSLAQIPEIQTLEFYCIENLCNHIAVTDSCGLPCQSRPGWAGHTCWSSEGWCRRCRPSSDAAAHTRCQPSWPPVRPGARWWWRCPETQWWWFWREPGWDREGNRERLARCRELRLQVKAGHGFFPQRRSFLLGYLVHDTEDDGVDEADPCHPHQAQQEQVSIVVQLEVGGFRVEDGAHQLAFLRTEACRNMQMMALMIGVSPPQLRLGAPTLFISLSPVRTTTAFTSSPA